MKQINETLQVRMTLEEANTINDLLKRSTIMPIVVEHKSYENAEGEPVEYVLYKCPACRQIIGEADNFCRYCGQYIDSTNTAL